MSTSDCKKKGNLHKHFIYNAKELQTVKIIFLIIFFNYLIFVLLYIYI